MKKILLTGSMLLCMGYAGAADIYVSPTGSDKNPGTEQQPKATITSALRQARELRRLNDPSVSGGVTLHLSSGNHFVYEPVFIRPEDSGTKESPTVITSAGDAVISGGVRIEGWKKQGKFYVADVPAFNGRPLDFRQFYVNGKKSHRSRDVSKLEEIR